MHGLRTPREEIALTARPKIYSHSQIFRYGGSIFCLPQRPIFSDILDLCLHWMSVARGNNHFLSVYIQNLSGYARLKVSAFETTSTRYKALIYCECKQLIWSASKIGHRSMGNFYFLMSENDSKLGHYKCFIKKIPKETVVQNHSCKYLVTKPKY